MLDILFYTLISIVSFFLAKYLCSINIFLDLEIKKKQAIHNLNIPRSGGLILFLNIMLSIIFNNFFYEFIALISVVFFIGFIDDYGIKIKPFKRFIILFFSIYIFVSFFEITLRTTGISWIDALMLKYNLGFLIITICFLILINGSNFIDGVNGNLTIHYFFLIVFIFFVNLENNYLNIFIYPTLISLAIFLIFNLKNKIFFGDGGAYLLGLILGILIIEMLNTNTQISPFFYLILTSYIGSEVLISFVRRFVKGTSTVNADFGHFHQLLFSFFKKKKGLNPHLFTAATINLIMILCIYPSFYFKNDFEVTRIYAIFLYVLITLFFVMTKIFLKK